MAVIVHSCAYCHALSLIATFRDTQVLRVLLTVVMQAGSGCSVPNRIVLYRTDPYRSVETSHNSQSTLLGMV